MFARLSFEVFSLWFVLDRSAAGTPKECKRERDSEIGWLDDNREICESVRKSSDPKLGTATTALAWKFQRRIIILYELSKTTGSQRG
uniref:Secreted protein n=1 Tax=Vespula pensylvanica TaxID=30213 RepID=A0A834PDT3_VESPE|nr:hypothetical protein H0235_000238 [Vespula pensylvanica]